MKDVDRIEELEETIKLFEGMRDENGSLTKNEQELLDELKEERAGYGRICEDCGGTGRQRKTVDGDCWCAVCGGTGINK